MKIITKIEINYFRSIYNLTLDKVTDINVLIGANDTGKSNILKALNLFFNNNTEIDKQYFFEDDLCRLRESEARAAKGRIFLWTKVTFNNFLNWKSLPDSFAIKKSWNRYSNQPAVDYYPPDVNQQTVSKFINKIKLLYVPAVRGRDIYSYYLNLLHDSLIEDEKAGVTEASTTLLAKINENIIDMSEKIAKGIGIESNIQVPKDLRELFSALDFSTSFSGHKIPLQKRGDGIQARHIPFILDFIARHSKMHYIWAYEEPENSLEMGKAFDLAQQFRKDFSKENQVFITTHSPAFYDLEGKNVRKWFVNSVGYKDNAQYHTNVFHLDTIHTADMHLGVAAVVAARAKELYNEIRILSETVQELDAAIGQSRRPQVLLEGPSDVIIFNNAYQKLIGGEAPQYEFVSARSSSNITAYINSANMLEKSMVPLIGIYDNDQEGAKEFDKFDKKFKKFEQTNIVVINRIKKIYCGVLTFPEQFIEIKNNLKQAIGQNSIPLFVEFLFPPDVIIEAKRQRILILKERKIIARDCQLSLPVNLTREYGAHLPNEYKHLAYEIDDACKVSFAKWTQGLEPEKFINFIPIFQLITQILE